MCCAPVSGHEFGHVFQSGGKSLGRNPNEVE